ncbi:MAG: hypothetical protein OHK0013_24570 [Sandaracinaceae bacterium]
MSEPEERTPDVTAWGRVAAFAQRNRSRLLRLGVLLAVVYAVSDLVGSTPRDTELVLPIEELLAEPDVRPDEVEVTIAARDGEPLTRARVRVPPGLETLHHTVSFPPGAYRVVVEARSALAREGSFEIPAEGAVRVHLTPVP